MFLFTDTASVPANDPPAASVPRSAPVADALRGAAVQSGVSFDYLMKTALRESNLVPTAKAGNSSATGLFQFLDQTWLGTVKKQGAKLGLQAEADLIVEAPGGHFSVPNAEARAKILALRQDPKISAVVAAAFTTQNKAALADSLGRMPSDGELYIAHFLGAAGAGTLTRQASEQPQSSAAAMFPEAASANHSIFYEASGRARTVGEVYSMLVTGPGSATASFSPDGGGKPAPEAGSAQSVGTGTPAAGNAGSAIVSGTGQAGKPLFGLFRSDESGAPAQPIRNGWGAMGRNPYNSASKEPAGAGKGGFFPSNNPALADRVAPAPADVAAPAAPRRHSASAPVGTAPARVSVSSPGAAQSKKAGPLDLLSFLKKRE